ncbi:MAG: hypothetical protein RMI31_00915 [Archaeoglobaceae archaeon]|nr:hypothetical protein [Archaeoglobaceae archaeon]
MVATTSIELKIFSMKSRSKKRSNVESLKRLDVSGDSTTKH